MTWITCENCGRKNNVGKRDMMPICRNCGAKVVGTAGVAGYLIGTIICIIVVLLIAMSQH